MRIGDRLLFLRYALPCASTLVRRGVISQDQVNRMITLVSKNQLPPEGAESIFKVANAMCTIIARRMGKRLIDDEVIRQYFLMEHSKVVDDRFSLMKDFDPTDCRTYAGKVVKVNKDTALVKTSLGEKKYRTIFARDVKENDDVAVHFNFIVERVPDQILKRIKEDNKEIADER